MTYMERIITPAMTRREARTALVEAGWTFVGGGSFAAVYGSPDGQRVVKVTKPDGGAEATYEVSVEHPDNPHLPVYFGRIGLANGGAAFEVERLEPFGGWYDYEEALIDARGTDAFEDAEEALFATGYLDDSHWRNAMRRETGEIVLTDWLYSENDLHTQATISAGQAEEGDFTDSERPGSCHWPDAHDEDGWLEAA